MKVEEALKILKENMGKSPFSVFIPSMGKSLLFSPVSVADKKSITKVATAHDDYINYMIFYDGLIRKICYEKNFLPINLPFYEFVALVSQIRLNSNVEPIILTFTCENDKCQKDINYLIDFKQIAENCNNVKVENLKCDIDYNNLKYTFEFGAPTMENYLGYSMTLESIRKNKNILLNPKNDIQLYYTTMFIKGISLNGEKIELDSYVTVNDIVQNIPDYITDSEKGIIEFVYKHYSPVHFENVFTSVKCPVCGNENKDGLTFDSFFTI